MLTYVLGALVVLALLGSGGDAPTTYQPAKSVQAAPAAPGTPWLRYILLALLGAALAIATIVAAAVVGVLAATSALALRVTYRAVRAWVAR